MIHLPPIINQLAYLLPTAAGIILTVRLRDQYHSQERSISFLSYLLQEIRTAYFSQGRGGLFLIAFVMNATILASWFTWSVPLIANPAAPTLLLICILLLSDWPMINELGTDTNDSEQRLVCKLVFLCLSSIVAMIAIGHLHHVQIHDPSLPGMERSEFSYRLALIDGQLFLHGVAGKLGLNLGVWAWKVVS